MGNSQAKLLLIGLDNSGKTTIVSKLTNPNYLDANITPTIGFQKQKFSRLGVDFQILDMSGESKYRDLWKTNVTNTNNQNKVSGIIFVIDSTNKMRINVARSELQIFLENQQVPKYIPYLFYSNKSDLKDSIPVQEVQEIMQLKKISRNYRICPCSGITGMGVQPGIQWLTEQVKKLIQKHF